MEKNFEINANIDENRSFFVKKGINNITTLLEIYLHSDNSDIKASKIPIISDLSKQLIGPERYIIDISSFDMVYEIIDKLKSLLLDARFRMKFFNLCFGEKDNFIEFNDLDFLKMSLNYSVETFSNFITDNNDDLLGFMDRISDITVIHFFSIEMDENENREFGKNIKINIDIISSPSQRHVKLTKGKPFLPKICITITGKELDAEYYEILELLDIDLKSQLISKDLLFEDFILRCSLENIDNLKNILIVKCPSLSFNEQIMVSNIIFENNIKSNMLNKIIEIINEFKDENISLTKEHIIAILRIASEFNGNILNNYEYGNDLNMELIEETINNYKSL